MHKEGAVRDRNGVNGAARAGRCREYDGRRRGTSVFAIGSDWGHRGIGLVGEITNGVHRDAEKRSRRDTQKTP